MDPYGLQRFIDAQATVYHEVCRELRAGRKTSHWMWFVFPQIAGLGRSVTAVRFAIGSLDEARAYLAHPVLGMRLRECTRIVNALEGRTAHEIFGSPDDLKFHSSMTLFAHAARTARAAAAAAQSPPASSTAGPAQTREASSADAAPTDDRVFAEAVRKYFDSAWDAGTLARIEP